MQVLVGYLPLFTIGFDMEIRRLFPWLFLVVMANSILWLDSIDQYAMARFHYGLSDYVPEQMFEPSLRLKKWINHENTTTEEVSVVPPKVQQEPLPKSVESMVANVPQSETRAFPEDKDPQSEPSKNEESVAQEQNQTILNANFSDNSSEINPPPMMEGSLAALPLKTESIKMMFAGDSMMQGVAPLVINSIRKIYPKGQYVDLSKQSTGLTVKRYFDWPQKIKDGIAKENFKVIVVFLGPNDPWDIYENHKVYKFPSNEWAELYRSRVESVLDFAKQNGAKVIWVGLPNMNEERVKKGAVIQNKIFKSETRKYHFQYVSTEDMLGRLDEPFKSVIHDPVKGDILVRAGDGIHFAPAGLRMISQGVIEAIKKLEKE
jgi:hypothetical protein